MHVPSPVTVAQRIAVVSGPTLDGDLTTVARNRVFARSNVREAISPPPY